MGFCVMAFLIKKENFWKFFDEVQLYFFKQFDNIKFEEMDYRKFHKIIEKLSKIFSLRFYVYENEFDVNSYVITVGYNTYAFPNSFWSRKKHEYKKYINKDLSTQNKADQSKKDVENEWVVDYVEKYNKINHYFVVDCIDEDIIRSRYFKRFFNKYKNKIKKSEVKN